jgi:BlaI family transcriptional regulator, penicillinase repressor
MPSKENELTRSDYICCHYADTGNHFNYMPAKPTLSEAEWKIMKLLWRQSPQPAYDLAEALAKTEKWSHRTVKTLLNRLLNKKAVTYEEYKNLYLYSPAITEEECVRAESESFVDRVFEGSLALMMVHFAKQKKLSKAELEELRRIAEKLED